MLRGVIRYFTRFKFHQKDSLSIAANRSGIGEAGLAGTVSNMGCRLVLPITFL
jgi:tartrate dehydratase alpha subunit/fumarate hydratase class I-like protein